MDEDFIRGRAHNFRDLATKADPFTKKRLLDLAATMSAGFAGRLILQEAQGRIRSRRRNANLARDEERESQRVMFERRLRAQMMAIDGSRRRACFVKNVPQNSVTLVVDSTIEGSQAWRNLPLIYRPRL